MIVEPYKILKDAIRVNPALRFAFGVVGVIAAVSLIGSLIKSSRGAILGFCLMLIGMALVLIFAKLSAAKSTVFASAGTVLLWFSLLYMMATMILVFTGVFFRWPLQVSVLISERIHPLPNHHSPEYEEFPPTFLDQMHKEYSKYTGLKVRDVHVKYAVWIHYLTSSYQIGFQGFLECKPSAREGIIPVLVKAAGQDPQSEIDAFFWRSNDAANIEFRHRVSNGLKIKSEDGKLQNLIVPKDYSGVKDSNRASDFFIIFSSEFHDPDAANQTSVEDFIIVKTKDIENWNPNQYVFSANPSDGQVTHSPLVYTEYASKGANDEAKKGESEMRRASDLLVQFERATSLSHTSNYDSMRRHLREVFADGSFLPGVTVFRATITASSQDVIFAYRLK